MSLATISFLSQQLSFSKYTFSTVRYKFFLCFFIFIFKTGFLHSTPGSRDNLVRDWETGERESSRPFDGSSGSREGSRGSREGSSGSKDCPPSPDRDGLVSPDIIRTVASTIQPSPRRRTNNSGNYGTTATTAVATLLKVKHYFTWFQQIDIQTVLWIRYGLFRILIQL